MKLVALKAFPYLHETQSRKFQVFAGAKLTTSQIELRFRIEASTKEAFSSIIIPAMSIRPERRDELWKSTCFECFIPGHGFKSYLEFNGSPNGDWNWYSFQEYREGMQPVPLTSKLEPKAVSMSRSDKDLEMAWVLPMSGAVQGFASHGKSVQSFDPFGLSVVLETSEVTTYWALGHEGVKPDFHTRASFRYDAIRS